MADLQSEYLKGTSENIEKIKAVIDNNIKTLRGEYETCTTKS